MMNVHDVVDRFARVASAAGILFAPLNDAPWVARFESKLPARLPASFRSLISRYSFPAFEVGSLALFANRGNDADEDELAHAVFKDKVIARVTLGEGYIQFARPAGGSYDPICFDANGRSRNRELPMVRLDHEAILVNSRLVVRETIETSFFRFIQTITAMETDGHGKVFSIIDQPSF